MSDGKQMVGRYEILRKIGEGGFGIVFEARDTVLDRTVAIKQLRAELSQIPEYLELFKREFRLMTNLSHPNINRLFDTFEEDGRYYIVMDYMPNGSLADKLKDGKPLSLTQTVEILKPIAKALDYAHSKNLIHRDVKPSNILFTESGEPMLSDFGLVKNVGAGITSTTTLALGTPDYMAPEQILARELTPAVDIYALGVVAFQMLTGKTPFPGNTPYEIQDGHVRCETPDIRAIDSSLPQGLTVIFHKVLAKKSDERFDSVKEFVQKLDDQIGQENQVKYQDKLNLAKTLMRQQDFHSAAILLEELFQSTPNEEVKEKLQECKRRAVVPEKKTTLVEPEQQQNIQTLNTKIRLKSGNRLYYLVQDDLLPISISFLGFGLFSLLTVLLPNSKVFPFAIGLPLILFGLLDFLLKKNFLRLIGLLISSGFLATVGSLNEDWVMISLFVFLILILLISLYKKVNIISSIVIALSNLGLLIFTLVGTFSVYGWFLLLSASLCTVMSMYLTIIELERQQ